MTMPRIRLLPGLVALVLTMLMAASGCGGDNRAAISATTSTTARSLPPPVSVRPDPQGITLASPALQPLPGARADVGRLGGAVYQIEVPANWNGRLVLYMHGYEDLGPEAHVSPPSIRRYLIGQGFAWGASSFSSTSLIPGRAADETAALWDYFARKYGRPTRTYVTGQSMGGMATHIAAERYGDRFDGALALCGSAGQTPAATGEADFFLAGAYVAGVTQAEFDTTNVGILIQDRILPALQNPAAHRRFENIMIDLTGGPRPFDRQGFRLEEATNWQRAQELVAVQIAPNRQTRYRLGPLSGVTSDQFNRAVIRLPINAQSLRTFLAGNETTGKLEIPLLTLHATGDGEVPIDQARILQQRVDAAGKADRLVQRVMRDPSHCGFTSSEWEANLEALVAWVEHGVKPQGTNVLVANLTRLGRTFELLPRPGTTEAHSVPGARDRVVVRGSLTLNGAPFDAPYLGVVVRRAGLVTPCQLTLSSVTNGRYEITVLADPESSGCGGPGAQILLWTFSQNATLYSLEAIAWPGNGGSVSFDATFLTSVPDGAALSRSEFVGEVIHRNGRELPPGTQIEAYVGATRCGIASVRRTGNFSGYVLDVVGPDSVAGCDRGASLSFRVGGRPAAETSVNDLRPHQGSVDLTQP
jgi:pimeloyl-ACP methyl ester carboxylesterase